MAIYVVKQACGNDIIAFIIQDYGELDDDVDYNGEISGDYDEDYKGYDYYGCR